MDRKGLTIETSEPREQIHSLRSAPSLSFLVPFYRQRPRGEKGSPIADVFFAVRRLRNSMEKSVSFVCAFFSSSLFNSPTSFQKKKNRTQKIFILFFYLD